MKIVIAGAKGTSKSEFLKEYFLRGAKVTDYSKPLTVKLDKHVVLFVPGDYLATIDRVLSKAFTPDLFLVFFDCSETNPLEDYKPLFDYIKEKSGKTEWKLAMIFPKYCSERKIRESSHLIRVASGLDWDYTVSLNDNETLSEILGITRPQERTKGTDKKEKKENKKHIKPYKVTVKDKIRAREISNSWVVRVVKPISNGVPGEMRIITDNIYDGIRVDAISYLSGTSLRNVKIILAILERLGYIKLESETSIENIL